MSGGIGKLMVFEGYAHTFKQNIGIHEQVMTIGAQPVELGPGPNLIEVAVHECFYGRYDGEKHVPEDMPDVPKRPPRYRITIEEIPWPEEPAK